MHIVIMGCGRVGSTLAHILEDGGHSVAIIDRDPQAFRRLRAGFRGRRVTGIGFDRDVLEEAGIESAGAYVAVSSGDNSNIISARVARETFGVDNVVARIYDSRRAEVYQRLGIPTVATVRWTADQILRRVLPEGAEPLWRDPTGCIILAEVVYHPGWIGTRTRDLEEAAGTRLAFVNRMGETLLPRHDSMVQEGDILHVMAAENDMDRISKVLSGAPEEEH
ncbi:TrkA family potassium uptake protein [Planomonospora sp. ID67723]|uniref:potassium channel family protein n=1 Tax=Planomonospora sp. ID67723 TaxID=2738134 RepID=UPI0018C3DD9A|nr:TrkA family potassium uptake protein [Planomonospora sp. ID67723]MBG0830811.1 TrkA family potassium uptake protein [Planomonospora sp. ID67723]